MPFLRLTVLALALASPAVAQEARFDGPVIVVEGRGTAERNPDDFFISGELRAHGPNQVAALQAIAAAQTRLTEGLADMDGLTAGRLRNQSFAVNPVSRDNCSETRRDEDACAIGAYSARMAFTFKGRPVDQAGNAASLAAELGATAVGVSGVEVEDRAALRAEANRLAFADARRQAETLAEASGQRITGIVRVQDRNARLGDNDSGAVDDVVVTGSRIRPTVAIPLAQPPVQAQATLTVVFSVE
ncbi:SIMPL domain-containing protein [Brevundimonas staleyi]|uniref:SIMPL domain-containing protein n=1 Tax=Brevundimonas staleyi TaxID=74326 RepID=A0ABW0FM68_9CAUL